MDEADTTGRQTAVPQLVLVLLTKAVITQRENSYYPSPADAWTVVWWGHQGEEEYI